MALEIYSDNETIIKICQDYWQFNKDGEFLKTTTEIAKENNISVHEVTKIAKNNSTFYSDEIFCETCPETFMFESRSEFKSHNHIKKWTCAYCESQKKQLEKDRKINFLKESSSEFLKKEIDFKKISVSNLIYLTALCRFASDEDLQTISPYSSIKDLRFTPNESIDIDLIKSVYSEKLISISPLSDLSKILPNNNGGYSFYMSEVRFILPSENPTQFINNLEEYISTDSFLIENKDEIEKISYDLSRQECLFYISHVLNEHGLNYSAGEKTILVIDKCLKEFSVSQVYNFIWRAGKDAAAFYLRNRVSKDHAAKTVVSNIERQFERAISNEWEVKSYGRNYDFPQSILSRVVFNSILKTDDGGFKNPIHKIFNNIFSKEN